MKIIIYEKFEEKLLREWNSLYAMGANYNLSPQWCMAWCKFFLKKNKLHIITVIEKDEVVAVAPFYKECNTLLLIGSSPDLYDAFDILYRDEKYLVTILDYIFESNFDIDFRYVEAQGKFGKLLIRYLYQEKINYTSHIIDTNPIVNLNNFVFKRNLKDDIKRCKNKAIKNYGRELTFEFCCEKSREEVEEFIAMHKERWGGGPFSDIPYLEQFVHILSKESLVVLAKLKLGDDAIAYHYCYIDSRGNLNYAIPSYDKKYSCISPGKVLISEMIRFAKENNVPVFNFGRGAESYKYWFANESNILFNIKTKINENRICKIAKIRDKFLNKIGKIIRKAVNG